uniref:MIER family member 2 n=1 Tax=Pan troglodytes TaxID=9598 RepID=H2QER8_PANTR
MSYPGQSPRVVSCLEHSLCPGEPGLQTTAVVSMGSGDHQFNLAEILSQNYSVRGECEEASRCPDKPKEELEKDFISQSNDMPFDELLALYGYEASDPISDRESEGGDVAPNLPDMTLDKEQIAKDLLSGEEEEETQSSADDLTPSVTSHEASDLFPNRSGSRFLADEDREPGSSASSDTEEDSLPANKCKKEIMVGPQFQADLSNLHLNRHCEKIYENEDQLLWDPSVLPEREVEEFLYRAVKRRWHEMAGPQLPEGEAVKDSEQALYELVKCNFNVEEALRRLRFNVKVIRDGLCAWSEEECRNFEHGFRVHGKNFHLIQANKVRTPLPGSTGGFSIWGGSTGFAGRQQTLGRSAQAPRLWARPRRLSVTMATASSLDEPGQPSTRGSPGPCSFQQLDESPVVPLSHRPPALADPASYQPAVTAPEPDASPRLAVDFALPKELPLISSHVDLSGDPEETVAPAQVALSVTEFGLIGIVDCGTLPGPGPSPETEAW